MTSADELEQTYRRIYRRLTLGMFVAYAVVFGVAVTVLVSGSATSRWLGSVQPARTQIEAGMIK